MLTQLSNLLHKIAFSLIKGNNPKIADQLLSHIGSEEDFFNLSEQALATRTGINGRIISDAMRSDCLERAKKEIDFIEQHHLNCIYYKDASYPCRLLECDDAPVMLYTLGNINLNAKHIVSIVGTRNATTYGVNFINKLVEELSERLDDILVLSGLAIGCDIAAHKQCLKLGVPTAAVVAHGLDTIYPAEHRSHAAQIVKSNGAIISDYPHGTPPHRGNFLARNRIVAGMADCVIVAESAANRGGALHTARLGMLYNRDVFALPGRTSDPYSAGCNMLIKTNVAHLIESADDLIKTMNWQARPKEGAQTTLFPQLTDEQQIIVNFITHHGETTTNLLTAQLGIPVGKLMALLVELEFNGVLTSLPGARYRLA